MVDIQPSCVDRAAMAEQALHNWFSVEQDVGVNPSNGIELKLMNTIAGNQRPRYSKDGSRGAFRDQQNKPLELRIQVSVHLIQWLRVMY
mgnify:FL=1